MADGAVALSRDAVGRRSLFWGRRPDGSVVAGPRFAGVLAEVGPTELDPVGLVTYLATAYVPGPRTLVRGVRAVPPGVTVHVGPGGERVVPGFALPPAPEVAPDEALRASLRATLERAVDRAIDGPCAASLSGGIDSSLVVALAARRTALTAFSVTFGAPHRDELEWSALVTGHCGVAHRVVSIGPEDVKARLDATVEALGAPNGDPLTVPNDRLFAAAADAGLAAMLNGEGGDPCFGGPKNAPMLLAELYSPGDRAAAYLRAHQKLWDELDVALHPDLRDPALREAVCAELAPWLEDGQRPYLDRLLLLNVVWKGGGHILPKVEQLAALHGVEPRSPLFDPEVVELSFRLPADTKRRGPIEKWLLKEAVRDLLPAAVVDRPKSGMMVPVEAWFQGPLHAFARERLLDGLAPRRIVDRAWLERLVDRRLGGLRPRHGVKVWLLLTLEAWLRRVWDPR